MTAPAVFFMSKKIIFEKFGANFSKLRRFLYNIPTGICILYKRRKRLFFFFFFFSSTHRYIYINVFCQLIKKKKKIVPSLLPFPVWLFFRFLICWRFSGLRFGVTLRATRKRGLTGASARFVAFGGLLTCRWFNGTAKQFDAPKTKNARKICVFQKNVVPLRKNSKKYATETQIQKRRVGGA